MERQPRWYALRSSRKGKKSSNVSGDIQLQFALLDPQNPSATATQIYDKFMAVTADADKELDDMDDFTLTRKDTDDMEEEAGETDALDDGDDGDAADPARKKKRRMRMAKLRRRARQQSSYEFTGESQVAGVLFLEISRIEDLPPEKNCGFSSCCQ